MTLIKLLLAISAVEAALIVTLAVRFDTRIRDMEILLGKFSSRLTKAERYHGINRDD